MATLRASFDGSVNTESSTDVRRTVVNWTDEVLYAYQHEYNVTDGSSEAIVFDVADDPNYSDFVLLRIQLVDVNFSGLVYVKITSGAGDMQFLMSSDMPIFDIPGVDVWNEDSAGGSADTIDQVEVTPVGSNKCTIRVTAYTVAS